MSSMSEVATIVEDLRKAAAAITEAVSALEELLSAETIEDAHKAVESSVSQPMPTLEDVRAVLAELSCTGHTDEIRALLRKHGADKLSAVNPADYADLLLEAQAIGNEVSADG